MALKLKKILLIGNNSETKQLYELLSDIYTLICADSTDKLLENWNSVFTEVSAVIIASEQAIANDYDFLKNPYKTEDSLSLRF